MATRHGPTIATTAGVVIAQQRHIDTRRRWTPVTEADLIAEKRQICGFVILPYPRWPRGWFDYRLLTVDAELIAQRKTRETTR